MEIINIEFTGPSTARVVVNDDRGTWRELKARYLDGYYVEIANADGSAFMFSVHERTARDKLERNILYKFWERDCCSVDSRSDYARVACWRDEFVADVAVRIDGVTVTDTVRFGVRQVDSVIGGSFALYHLSSAQLARAKELLLQLPHPFANGDPREIDHAELEEKLALHAAWLRGEPNGKQLDLTNRVVYKYKKDNADFSYSVLVRTEFTDCVLPGANFRAVSAQSAKFGGDMQRADFTGALALGAEFRGLFQYARFDNVRAENTRFSGSFDMSSFHGTSLKTADACSYMTFANACHPLEIVGAITPTCSVRKVPR